MWPFHIRDLIGRGDVWRKPIGCPPYFLERDWSTCSGTSKNMKFAINLEDEKEALEVIDNKADMMDE